MNISQFYLVTHLNEVTFDHIRAINEFFNNFRETFLSFGRILTWLFVSIAVIIHIFIVIWSNLTLFLFQVNSWLIIDYGSNSH